MEKLERRLVSPVQVVQKKHQWFALVEAVNHLQQSHKHSVKSPPLYLVDTKLNMQKNVV